MPLAHLDIYFLFFALFVLNGLAPPLGPVGFTGGLGLAVQ